MNERIKQMWTKVCQDEMPELDESCMTLQRQAKFAELIVGECLKIAKNREDELESAGLLSESNAVGNVSYRISRQFGVKR